MIKFNEVSFDENYTLGLDKKDIGVIRPPLTGVMEKPPVIQPRNARLAGLLNPTKIR